MDKKLMGTGAIVVLAAIILGLSLWYMATHQAPTAAPLGQAATPAEPEHLSDHGQYYDADGTYPPSTPLAQTAGAQADADAVTTLKGYVTTQIDGFKGENALTSISAEDAHIQGLDQGRKYDLEMTYEMHQSAKTVSYVYTSFTDTLGAHPNTNFRSFTFDLATGTSLALDDLFQPGTAFVSKLSQISRAQLPALIAARENVPVAEVDTSANSMLMGGTAPDPDNFQEWYLDGSNLVLIFTPYQVGPYVLGVVTLPIPLSSLSDILLPHYAQ